MPKVTLILHNIGSTCNVGAIFRTADGFGVERIICSGYTPYPAIPGDSRLPHMSAKTTTRIHKTALGAETMVPFEYVETLEAWLGQNDLPVYALEQSPRSVSIRDFLPPERFALLLGEEVAGIAPDLLKNCDKILEIPMTGQKESFNVSVATAIALYALTST